MLGQALAILLIASQARSGADFCDFQRVLEQEHRVTYVAFDHAAMAARSCGHKYIDLCEGRKWEDIDDGKKAAALELLHRKIASVSCIIVDIGCEISHIALDIAQREFPEVKRLVYYDNPEIWVPGTYSAMAAKTCPLAQGILFANANLQAKMILDSERNRIFPSHPRPFSAGIGYYPMQAVESLRNLRKQSTSRQAFFDALGIDDQGQKLIIYAGGATEEYYDKAWPAFLKMLRKVHESYDIRHWMIILQQHPRAMELDRDKKMLMQVASDCGLHAYVSPIQFSQAFAAADIALYYQTTANIQFVMAGLRTLQVGHLALNDQTVHLGLVPSITHSDELYRQIEMVSPVVNYSGSSLEKRLGIYPNWAERLTGALD